MLIGYDIIPVTKIFLRIKQGGFVYV